MVTCIQVCILHNVFVVSGEGGEGGFGKGGPGPGAGVSEWVWECVSGYGSE